MCLHTLPVLNKAYNYVHPILYYYDHTHSVKFIATTIHKLN